MNHSGSELFKNVFSLQSLSNAKNLILNSKEIVLLCHKNADLDTAGCAIAMAKVLKHLGKHFRVIYPNAPSYKPALTLDYELIASCDIVPDLCMSFDAPTLTRFFWDKSFERIPLISVDHHANFDIKATEQFVDQTASSACEVLAKLLFWWDSTWLSIPGVSQILLEGQLSDSHTFRTSSSNQHSLATAILLMDMGADFMLAKKSVAKLHSPDNLRFIASIIKDGNFDRTTNSFAMICPKELIALNRIHPDDLQGLVSIVSQMVDCDVTIFVYQINQTSSKCSLRSKTTDVAKICKVFGGGGHVMASGFEDSETDCETVVQKVRSELFKAL